MVQLVYVSSAIELFSNEALLELLRKSREKNRQLDITGLLLYKEGNFIQVLEGPDEVVQNLYAVISKDSRHTGLITLSKTEITEREFGDWAMGFRNMTKIAEREAGLSSFLTESIAPETFQRQPSRALIFLRTFRNITD